MSLELAREGLLSARERQGERLWFCWGRGSGGGWRREEVAFCEKDEEGERSGVGSDCEEGKEGEEDVQVTVAGSESTQ